MNKVLVVLGPTATGKTDRALKLAKMFNGELVACDSRQVYKGLDIGTGKKPSIKGPAVSIKDKHWEIDGVKVWMYDVNDPNVQYSVSDYFKQANEIIGEILRQKRLPIVVGGTGLYLKGLLGEIDNLTVPVNQELRVELEQLELSELQSRVVARSPIKWTSLSDSDKKNKRRLVRLIEMITMYPYVQKNQDSRFKNLELDVLKIGLTAPRSVLYQKIDLRLDNRVDEGLIKEGQRLLKSGLSLKRMRQLGLEYGVLADLLEGCISRDQFETMLKNKIHQYAKRQLTWFKKYEADANWFDITNPDYQDQIEKLVRAWYDKVDD